MENCQLCGKPSELTRNGGLMMCDDCFDERYICPECEANTEYDALYQLGHCVDCERN